ncbi:DNA-directed RNA polymerase subunit [Melia azedarach]|uniref:DNA-directed RNA polymerase subunit n=1 Tax=Melia azedarach TaxID=155640 RepID=A0ACC1YBE3_MELAZ|nr:DNA-directed RNA polymerase subunit [Melia azedarach]
MEENTSSTIVDGQIIGIRFGLATHKEICTASVSDCSISHASQLANPFLGLPLEFGKCESCGTSEPGKCEGHFGFIELPIPIYHPSHISELKRMLSLLCLKCLKMKNSKIKNDGVAQRLLSACCEEASQVSIVEVKTTDGACYLELKLPSKFRLCSGFWNFLERYGFRYGDGFTRTLLPSEVKEMLKRIPEETRKKLAGKGYFPQDGYILEYLPVPPNCLSVPDISDGVSIMSSDLSLSMLKKVLKQVEIINSSRSGVPNFESHEVEANDLQLAVRQYLEVRGTAKASRDVDARYGISQDSNSSTKAWLEKMRTLFIRKGSGFSSRSVITGDAYKRVNEIGIPFEIAQRITFEERVSMHNMKYLQELVDNNLCLTYRDGSSTYSLREGSKGHTFLRPGQVVHRRIMDGDTVFINRPPTTHKHSLQALSVYVHDDHTVKINPLICGPLSADFDGDCIHLFYPQSLAAKAEVLELFSVEKQLLSSHNGKLNLQLATDSLLSLKVLFRKYLLDKAVVQQLAMFVLSPLPRPALLKAQCTGPRWTALQILQSVLPDYFECCGERYLIREGDVLKFDFDRDIIQSLINEVVASIFFEKGPQEVLKFFDSLQPLLMENLFVEGFSVGLEDFSLSKSALLNIQKDILHISPLLFHLRSTQNEIVELQVENYIRRIKVLVAKLILKSSTLGYLIDSKSDSAVSKVVQQAGFLGLQLSDKGKFYSKTLVEDVAYHFQSKYPTDINYPSAKYGLIKGCFFHGLDAYEEMVHSISTREVIVRSSRGLSEPGTLFKNLMAVLRDVVICYDGTVRNVCSNSIIQFEYGVDARSKSYSLFPAGEPVGVLAATAMSNPAYKAVLDSTPSSNSSWELMKEILLCRVSFKNEPNDRRVILYLNDCDCGRKYCRERAAYMVKNQLKRVSLKDTAVEFLIEYGKQQAVSGSLDTDAGLVGHIHLNEMLLKELDIDMHEILPKCQENIKSFCKKKKMKNGVHYFKNTSLSISQCCSFQQSCTDECSNMPCLMFFLQDTSAGRLDKLSGVLANIIYPVLLETIIKGDPRVSSVNIIWISPDTTTWIRNPTKTWKGELALDVVLEKSVVKQSGDAWRIVLDSCLPVFHLIDTRRSVPYAIKEVQELLGVSCAFEQAVQRLSASVTMVAKGILKEHLILLANSMTCVGNLVGFNSGGYKALSRSLNVQVPFTEATLFTPRKCFEKAAEKCHTDNLSSVVAACSWGKHVAVGTGSRFDVLWDTKNVGSSQEDGIDVYNFLHMVRSSASVEQSDTGCLGEEVDELEDEMDWSLSPEHNFSSDKPVFEDCVEDQNWLENKQENGNWEKVSSSNNDSRAAWEKGTDDKSEKVWTSITKSSTGWGTAWGKGSDKMEKEETAVAIPSTGWGKDTAWGNGSDNKMKKVETPVAKPSSGWGTAWGKGSDDKMEKEENPVAKPSTGWEKETAWGNGSDDKMEKVETTVAKPSTEWGAETSWGKGSGNKWEKVGTSRLSGWGSEGYSIEATEECGKSSCWEGKDNANPSASWDRKGIEENSSWDTTASWKIKAQDKHEDVGCAAAKSSSVWGSQGGFSTKAWEDSSRSSACNNMDEQPTQVVEHVGSPIINHSWGQPKTSDIEMQPPSSGGWDVPAAGGNDGSSWGGQQKLSGDDSRQEASSNPWDLPNATDGNESEKHLWGQSKRESFKKNRFEGSRGWPSNSGEWKGKKNRPPRSPAMMNEDSVVNGMYTVTRRRLDMFTSEEQDILSDIEPIMRSIRKIMHQSGYNDGDPLSADDHSFVADSVFNYHPDKAAKMGAGIDHFTVDKHGSFQGSRCFFVVSTDGSKQDFSSRKCLESFVKGKYPSLADEFIGKYFRKP